MSFKKIKMKEQLKKIDLYLVEWILSESITVPFFNFEKADKTMIPNH